MTRFQALTVLSEQKLHSPDVYSSPYEIETVPVKKLTFFFSRPKLAHLAIEKFVQFCWSHVNARGSRASFCTYKNLSEPV